MNYCAYSTVEKLLQLPNSRLSRYKRCSRCWDFIITSFIFISLSVILVPFALEQEMDFSFNCSGCQVETHLRGVNDNMATDDLHPITKVPVQKETMQGSQCSAKMVYLNLKFPLCPADRTYYLKVFTAIFPLNFTITSNTTVIPPMDPVLTAASTL